MPRWLAMLMLVAAMALTGLNVPFGKAIVAVISVEAFLLVRFGLASLVLTSLVHMEPGVRLLDLGIKQWLAVLALAVIGSVLYTIFMLEGLRRTSAADAGVIAASLPAVVAVIAWSLGARLRLGQAVMVALAVIGVAIIHWPHQGFAPAAGAVVGNLLVGGAVLCEATFVLVSRSISRVLRPFRLSLAVSLVSLMVCLGLAVLVPGRFVLGQLGSGIIMLMIWYALTSSVVCTALWYRGAPHVEPWAAGMATAALPVAALLGSAAFIGETISWAQLAGGLMVVLAIAAGTITLPRLRSWSS